MNSKSSPWPILTVPLCEREAQSTLSWAKGDAGSQALSLPQVLTLEGLEGVHEVQVGLQRDQARLNHVRVPQVRCERKRRQGDRLAFPVHIVGMYQGPRLDPPGPAHILLGTGETWATG